MKHFAFVVVGLVTLVCGHVALADMYLQGVGGDHSMAATNDRFYTGADKAFIGTGLDFSGVGGNSPWATMISPQYFITAYHYPSNGFSSLTFYEGNTTSSGAHTYAVDSSFHFATSYNGSPSDVYLGRLAAPIPAADHIAYYPVLTLPSYSDYAGLTIYTYGVPNCVGKNVITSVGPYAEAGENEIGMFYNYDVPGVGASESYLMGGDSGGPSFAVVNGKLALLGEHFSNWGTSGLPGAPGNVWPTAGDGSWWSVDGFLPAYIDQLDANMGGQSITTIPEPATLSLLLLGAIGLVRTRRARRA
jgi:hypothetical protein